VNWATATLGSVARIERKSITPAEIPSGSRYVGLEHIESGGASLSYGEVLNGELASNKFCFSSDHILFGKLRPYLAKIVCPDFSGICSTDILPISSGKNIDKRYLLHFLRRPQTVEWASTRSTGVNLPRLSPSELETLEIPLPPLDEQRRIAAILDKADALRRKRKRALELLGSLGQSIFGEMFGNLVESSTYRRGTISDWVVDFDTGKNLAPDPDDRRTNGYRVLKVSAVTSGTFLPTEAKPLPRDYEPPSSHFVDKGDLLFSRANTAELIGATAYVDSELSGLVLPDKIWRFVWRQANEPHPRFIQALFSTPEFRREISKRATGTSGSMKNISKEKVLSIEVAMPDRRMQNKFAERLAALDQSISAATAQSLALDRNFSSLQHRAFSGQL